jgi:hypothetical protein
MFHNENINSELVMSALEQDVNIRVRNVESALEGDENVEEEEDVIVSLNKNIFKSTVQTSTNSSVESGSAGARQRVIRKQSGQQSLNKLLDGIYGHMDQLGYSVQRDNYKECINTEWLLIGVIMDKILFFVYCFIVILSTMVIFKS